MEALLLSVSLACALANGTARKYGMKRYIDNQSETFFYNAVSSLITSAILIIMMAITGQLHMPSTYTLLLGLVFGVVTALSAICNLTALGCGPLSYTTVIVACSMIIPSLFGLFRGETLRPVHYIGIAMMLCCMVLSVSKEEGEKKKVSLFWFACCMVDFVCSGSIGILQQIHQSSAHKDELNQFLLVAFLFSAVFCFAVSAFFRRAKHENFSISMAPNKPLLWICVISGIGVAGNNIINLYLSGVMNPAVFFPIVNGGSLILSAGMGIFAFREKFSARKWVGLGIGVAAILLLCLDKVF